MKKRIVYTSKQILQSILRAGIIALEVSTSGYSIKALIKALYYSPSRHTKNKKKRNYTDSFYYLKRKNLISYRYQGKQLYIALTPKGRKLAKRYFINNLVIKQSKKWDKKWRVIIFDIKSKQKHKREALRGKLKDLGFYQLQKSVWAIPYKCHREVDVLRNFFSLNKNELKIITAANIENDYQLRYFFKL